jgi:hypothetical protein
MSELPTTKQSWKKRPQNLASEIETIKQAHASDLVLARVLMRLYWNRPLSTRSLPNSTADMDLERYAAAANRIAGQLGFNLLRDLVDGLAARVCRQMACHVMTVGGDASLQQSASKMSRLIDGLNEENNTREVLETMTIDACTCRGFGAGKVYFDEVASENKFERIDPMSVFFRYSAGPKPRELFVQSTVLREYMLDTYPKKADMLARVPTDRRPLIAGVEPSGATGDDTVLVNEGWQLARGDEPGRWVMTCGQVVLENEPYPYDFHQVILLRMLPEYTGAGGVSLARLGAPYHRWLNQLVRIAHDSFRGNVPRITRHAGTTINQGGISDIPFAETIWEGPQAPQIDAGNVVSEQLLNFLPTLRQQAHVDTGVNENMSSGVKPTGINSGQALRDYTQFADARLNGPNERYARAWADVGKAFIGISGEYYKSRSIVVKAPGAAMLQEIKWSDVDLKKNKYRLQFQVTSGLSQTVPGKMQDTADLQDLGVADAIDAADMLKATVPDIAAFADRVTAPRKLAQKMVEESLEGIIWQPSILMGPDCLNAILLIGSQMYAKATMDQNHTPEQLECLRKLLKAARRKLQPPTPPLPAVVPVPSAPAVPAGAIRAPGFQGPPGAPPAAPAVPPPPPAQ